MREMKDSSVEWLGEVPAGWELHRAKHLFKLTNDRGNDDLTLLAATQKHGMWPQDRLEGVVHVKDDTDLSKFRTVHKNDYVISLRSFQGGFERSDFEGVCSPAYQTFCAIKPIDYQYFKYLFKSPSFIDHMNSLTLGIREGKTIKFDDFAAQALAVPPLDEQRRIANYLDGKCDEIDRAVSAAERSIEEYKAYKNSIVNQIITKGLNSNVPMKDSGVEWLGEVPAEWALRQAGQLAVQTKVPNEGMIETNLLSLSYGKVKRRDINATDGLLPASFETYNVIGPNDIVLRFTDLQNDQKSLRVGRATERGIITSAYVTVRPLNPSYSRFMYYALHAYDLRKGFYGMGAGVRQGLKWQEAKYIKLPWPGDAERDRIADFLDEKCDEIDRAVSAKQAIIADLKAYKQSLIYEAVTGKREV